MANKGKRLDEVTGVHTVGHEWDGIEELDHPMPRWWLWVFYATIFWAFIYVILFPAWPLLNSATPGVLGWTSRGKLEKELQERDTVFEPIRQALATTTVERIPDDPRLLQAAINGGRSAFKVYCVQCHGSGAEGAPGYPNLNDDDWLWGGDILSIHKSIHDGIRQPDHDDTRFSQMPAYGRDGILNTQEIDDVVSHILVISAKEKPSASSGRGAEVFANNCVVCHGVDGTGLRQFGAPDLTDAITLYGSDRESLTHTVTYARNGVMPAWGPRLDPVTVKMLAVFVHSLGGGEALPPAAPADEQFAEAGVSQTVE